MTRTRTALICLIASAGLSACTTMDAVQEAELDVLTEAIDEAVLAGDYPLAMELGYEYLGLPIDGNDAEATPATGYMAGVIIPGEDGGPRATLRGRMIDPDLGDRHQIYGMMAAPLDDQVRGIVAGSTHQSGERNGGSLFGDYRTVGGETDQGGLRATWNVEGSPVTSYIDAHWHVDSDGVGRVFGTWTELEVPTWEEGVRVRIDVSGLTEVHVSDDKVWVTQVLQDEDAEEGSTKTYVNGEDYTLEYSELSCPEYDDADCNSVPMDSPDGAIIDLTAGATSTTFIGRGGMSLVQEPNAENGYEAIVMIDDLAYAGASAYELEINPL